MKAPTETGAASNTAQATAENAGSANTELKESIWQKGKRKWNEWHGPLQTWGNWAKNHPQLTFYGTTLPVMAGTGMLVALGSRRGDDPAYRRVPTMTPYEKAMYDRMNSGMAMPGLGLDPAYLHGLY